MKFKQFEKILLTHKSHPSKSVLIFMHDFPDPDALTSAWILKTICEHFGFLVKVVYGGKIVRAENRAMVKLLKLKVYLYRRDEEKKFTLTALVDTNQYIRNHRFPNTSLPDLTFDHHRFKNSKSYPKLFDHFYEINQNYGSCASILLEYLLHFKIDLTSLLATAYCYTILAETNHFERDFSKKDIDLYRKAVQKADLGTISKIINVKKPPMYFNTLKKGLNHYQKKEGSQALYCHLDQVESIEMIHQIADFLLRMEEINLVVVTGSEDGQSKRICIRSRLNRLHVGNLLRLSLKENGQGGGHKHMASGVFSGNEKEITEKFLKLANKK